MKSLKTKQLQVTSRSSPSFGNRIFGSGLMVGGYGHLRCCTMCASKPGMSFTVSSSSSNCSSLVCSHHLSVINEIAGFAAFAGRFDVYYGFPNDYGLEDPGYYSERTSGFFAFRGMTIMYIISRIFLCFQYLLLYYYARVKRYPAQNQFVIQIASLVISGGMWVGSYFLESEDSNDAMKIAKYGLWYGAIFIEMAAAILIWWTCRTTGFRRTHLTERFATLTLLILGEGVIGYAIALQAGKRFVRFEANWKLSEGLVGVLLLESPL
jgi:hypothetical protein